MAAFRLLLLLAVLLVPASADAVTVRDIIELTKAGLSDDILVALIDADRTIFTLDKDQILELKRAGVGRAVLLKMLRTRREFDTPPPQPAPEALTDATSDAAGSTPGLVVIGAQPAPPVTVVVPQYVPQYYYVPYFPVPIWGVPNGPRAPAAPFMPAERRGFGRFMNDGWVDRR